MDYTNKTIDGFYIIGKDKDRFLKDEQKVESGLLKRFNTHWIGVCHKCNVEKSISATNLAKNKVGCSCEKKYYAKDISGNVFGYWKVINRDYKKEEEYSSRNKYPKIFWNCECVCGINKSISSTHLKGGKSTNCGCVRDKNVGLLKTKDIKNNKFGKLIAKERYVKSSDTDSKLRTYWICLCECGNKEYVPLDKLTSGEIKECSNCRTRKHIRDTSNMAKANELRIQKMIDKDGSFGELLLNRYSIEDINKIWSDKNILSPFYFTKKSHKDIIIKCPNCEKDYKTNPLSISGRMSYVECPSCFHAKNCSSYERTVKDYINNNLKLELLHENYCNLSPINPKTNSRLYYDNEIINLKIIIEVHGKQHYEEILDSCWWIGELSPKEFLENLQYRDNYKKEFAINNGYLYLELSYLDIINESYKNKINEIILERIK